MASIRTFVALSSSPEVQSALSRIQSQLKEEKAEVRWDSPEKFHITLKFLGNVDEQNVAPIGTLLGAVVSAIPQFDLTYSFLGAFPDFAHPRVFWVGAQSNATVELLQKEIATACEKLGFPREEKKFHPHITLGRVKGTLNLNRLTAKAKSITFDPIIMRCSGVLLIKSDLRSTGSIYSTLNSFPFKA